jgi:hypothetical protein
VADFGSAARSGALPVRFFQSSMAVSFQSLEFIGSTTTIQQRAFDRHLPLGLSGKLLPEPAAAVANKLKYPCQC